MQNDDFPYKKTQSELAAFLKSLVRDDLLEYSDGVYSKKL
jgi:hypothetical protein